MQENQIIEQTTCFSEHKKRNLNCCKKSCRLWMESNKDLNCAILASEQGEHTLQEIGDIFGVTRMRICQMEKTIMHVMNFHQCIKLADE